MKEKERRFLPDEKKKTQRDHGNQAGNNPKKDAFNDFRVEFHHFKLEDGLGVYKIFQVSHVLNYAKTFKKKSMLLNLSQLEYLDSFRIL